MRIQKVRRYEKPGYPEREMYALQPGLLARWIPTCWLKSKAVMGILLAFVLSGVKGEWVFSQTSQPAELISQEKADTKKETVRREMICT